ncbi:MAG TPA: GNAT family N-acetyltransferase [Armatimonadota bacterium]|nr:GNAT family N-acetyltransferase [Armatimonadota bacterium]
MLPADVERFQPIHAVLKNGMAVCVRPLTPNDGEAMAEFYISVPREDGRFYLRPSELTRENALTSAANSASPYNVELILESADKRIMGYAWYRWEDTHAEKSVFGICIHRECQGGGAGKLLFSTINAVAEHIGPPVMSLTVQQANQRAFALYQKMGFSIVREQEVSERDGFPAEPEWYMERRTRQ